MLRLSLRTRRTLLTFIPACGDFINAALLGTPKQYMIGNVIQSKFLNILDYPTAAALSFTLMLFILIGIFIYARLLGARNLTEAAIEMAAQAPPQVGRALDEEIPGPPRGGKSRDRLRHGFLAIWSALA